MNIKAILFCAAAMLALTVNSFATTDTWTGGGSGSTGTYNFSNASNWSFSGTGTTVASTDTLVFTSSTLTPASLSAIYDDVGSTSSTWTSTTATFGNIVFNGNFSSPITMSGNAFVLGQGTGTSTYAGITSYQTSQSITINNNLFITPGDTSYITAGGNATTSSFTAAGSNVYALSPIGATSTFTLSGNIQTGGAATGSYSSLVFASGNDSGYSTNTGGLPVILLSGSNGGWNGGTSTTGTFLHPINITLGTSIEGAQFQGSGILEVTSDAAFGNTSVTDTATTPYGYAGQGWLILFGNYASKETISFNAPTGNNVTNSPWGIGAYTGTGGGYTGTATFYGNQTTGTSTIPLALDAESGSIFSLGTVNGSGSITGTATFINSFNGKTAINFVKTGAGTAILNDLAFSATGTSNISTPMYTIENGALRETGSATTNSVQGSYLILDGGVLETNNSNYTAGAFTRSTSTVTGINAAPGTSSQINMTGGGGFSAYGGALTVDLNNGTGTVTWNSGGFVNTGNALIFGSQTANNVVTFQNAIATGTLQRTIQVIGTGTSNEAILSGVLSGTGGLIKTGSGVLVLQATNTYTGATSINAGTLIVSGSTASGSAFTIASGGALGGTGTVGGSVTLSSGGAINLVDGSIGTLHIGGLSTTGGGTLDFEIGGSTTSTDFLSDAGAFTASGTSTITIANLGSGSSITTGTYNLISSTSSLTLSNFSLSNTTLDGDSLSLRTSGSSLQLVVGNITPSGTYTLTTTVGSTILHIGATTTATTTLTNTGGSSADSLNYTGLGSTAVTGSITGSTGSGGPVANSGGTAVVTQTYTATTAGTDTVTPTGSVTGVSAGTPTDTGTTTAVVTVYSGAGVWNTAGGGTWGTTETTTPANWTAGGGIPGITSGFTTTDSASFGNTGFSGTATVTLSGASPYLNAITFNNSQGSYDIEQGSTGTIHLSSTGTATVTVSAGSHKIGAPIELDSNGATSVASSDTLTLSGSISEASGSHSLTTSGPGTTVLSGSNSYSGGTTVSSGMLRLSNTSGSATGSGTLTVNGGATIGGRGTSSGASFNIAGTGTSTSSRANVLVGLNSTSDTNTTHTLTLTGSSASTIANANLTFNISATSAGQGTELNVGSTAITFGAGTQSTTLTLNIQNEPAVIGANTAYVLIAGNDGTGADQYSGLTLGASTGSLATGLTTAIINSGLGQSGNLTLALTNATDINFYGTNSYLFLYQNSTTGADDIEVEVVPEPSSWALMFFGLALLFVVQRARRNKDI